MWLRCGAVYREGVQEGTMLLAWLLAGFRSLPLLPISKLGPSGADSQMGGFVYILGSCGSFKEAKCIYLCLHLDWKFPVFEIIKLTVH